MARHIHVHLGDSGTSEGAKKAAATRKAHGGGGAKPTGQHQNLIQRHEEHAQWHTGTAKALRYPRAGAIGGARAREHEGAAKMHKEAISHIKAGSKEAAQHSRAAFQKSREMKKY